LAGIRGEKPDGGEWTGRRHNSNGRASISSSSLSFHFSSAKDIARNMVPSLSGERHLKLVLWLLSVGLACVLS